jgi:flagellar biosynthesis protein FlhF
VDLPDLLRRSGFSETFLARLRGMPSWTSRESKPLHVTLVDLGDDLRKMFSNRRLRPLPSRTAFIGTMGVGRTTALCKWLGAEVFARGRNGRVLKVEFDKPNPAENLNVYCEALGLGLEHYSLDTDLSVNEGEFLYADLPGFEFRRPKANNQLANFLNASKFEGRVLVLNALYDLSTLRAAYSAGRELGATHLVFTHCDELVHWGKLMDFLMDGDLSPLFLATGPSLSGDCIEDCYGAVLHKTIPGA